MSLKVATKEKLKTYQEEALSIRALVEGTPSRKIMSGKKVSVKAKVREKVKPVDPITPERVVPSCNCCGTTNNVGVLAMAGWMCPTCAREGGYL